MGLTNDPTCKSLILLVSGYNLKVRGSNPLPATNALIINSIYQDFILHYLSNGIFFIPRSHRTFLLVLALLSTTQVFLLPQPCLYLLSEKKVAYDG